MEVKHVSALGAYRVPEARTAGDYSERVRWRLLCDGIGKVIEYCPRGERQLVYLLQQAFIRASARRIEGLSAIERDEELFA